ncbi:MAG: hypothetical protein ACK5HL_00920 [Bacilli bacterium]
MNFDKINAALSANLTEYIVIGFISLIILVLVISIFACLRMIFKKEKQIDIKTSSDYLKEEDTFDIYKAFSDMNNALNGHTIAVSPDIIKDVDGRVSELELKNRRYKDGTRQHVDIIDAAKNSNIKDYETLVEVLDIKIDEPKLIEKPKIIADEKSIDIKEGFKPSKFISPVYGTNIPIFNNRISKTSEILKQNDEVIKNELSKAENLLSNLKNFRKTLK